jgi:hypothetical protein
MGKQLQLTILAILAILILSACKTPRLFPSAIQQPHHRDSPSALISDLHPSTLQLDYISLSKWLFVAGIVALFFRHNWGAGCAFAGAILGPLVGKMADTILALSTYLIFGSLALGFIVAWHVLSNRLSLPDDENLWSYVSTKFRK